MRIDALRNISLIEKLGKLYLTIEELFHELSETKKFELTPQFVRKLYDALTLYNDMKTELTNTYGVNLQENTKYDPLEPMFHLIIDSLMLVQSLYYELLLSENTDVSTLFVLDNIMSRIQRTILFYHYFHFTI